MHDQWLTLDEAALLLLVDRQTIECWLGEGLERHQRGDQPMIHRADLDQFLVQNGQGASRDAALENREAP